VVAKGYTLPTGGAMQEIDVRDLACPGPVLKLRDMLDAATITALGIDPSARAETLAIEDFAVLANHMSCTPQSG